MMISHPTIPTLPATAPCFGALAGDARLDLAVVVKRPRAGQALVGASAFVNAFMHYGAGAPNGARSAP